MLRSTNSEYTFGLDESTLTPAFQLKIEANNQKAEEVSIFHTTEKTTWYARSTHSRGLVKLIKQSISGLSEDIPNLFAAPEATNTEEPKK